ncbi:DDE-type integrase/transposase/recombinase [Micromonospora sp. KC207]|uniref:DDE-type integrase/transposase/recombinase n=1 Tax=Micromonospora sp. KC207 TaxID=2530377 RepID=UPI00352FBC46
MILSKVSTQVGTHVEQYANNPVEADHSRLKHRLRSMRGLHTDRTAQAVIAGHAFIQNLCRGHHEIAVDETPSTKHPRLRLAAAFAIVRARYAALVKQIWKFVREQLSEAFAAEPVHTVERVENALGARIIKESQ